MLEIGNYIFHLTDFLGSVVGICSLLVMYFLYTRCDDLENIR